MVNLFDLTGKTAIVMGGTGALGGAMAEALGAAGAFVAVTGRNQERGEARVAAITGAGGKGAFFTADAMSRESLEAVRAGVLEQTGRLDILVNAAGGNKPGATLPPGSQFADLSLEAWGEVFELNLVGGVVLPCQVFAPPMLEAGSGSIINIASMAGMTPLSRVVGYSASKAAVINLTRFLAREWATRGVRVNAISPGFLPAEQNRALLFNPDGSYSERGHSIINHTPMGRFGEPHEMQGAVLWLAADAASSFVTGQNIVVDGGFSAVTI